MKFMTLRAYIITLVYYIYMRLDEQVHNVYQGKSRGRMNHSDFWVVVTHF